MTRPTLGAPPAAKLLIPKGSLAAVLTPGVSRGATGAEKGLVVEGGELIGLPATLLGSRGARVGGGARRAGTGAGAWIKELNEEILGFFPCECYQPDAVLLLALSLVQPEEQLSLWGWNRQKYLRSLQSCLGRKPVGQSHRRSDHPGSPCPALFELWSSQSWWACCCQEQHWKLAGLPPHQWALQGPLLLCYPVPQPHDLHHPHCDHPPLQGPWDCASPGTQRALQEWGGHQPPPAAASAHNFLAQASQSFHSQTLLPCPRENACTRGQMLDQWSAWSPPPRNMDRRNTPGMCTREKVQVLNLTSLSLTNTKHVCFSSSASLAMKLKNLFSALSSAQ